MFKLSQIQKYSIETTKQEKHSDPLVTHFGDMRSYVDGMLYSGKDDEFTNIKSQVLTM